MSVPGRVNEGAIASTDCLMLIPVHGLHCPWYVGLAPDGSTGEAETKKHAMARFEWILSSPHLERKENVDVRSDNVKTQGVPLPQAWTKVTTTHVDSECSQAERRATRHIPETVMEAGASISCRRVLWAHEL